MKYYLITGKIPGTAGRDEQPWIPEQQLEEPGGRIRIIPERPYSPAIAPVPDQDNRIKIGESNPFDTSGKPFKITYHTSMGIGTVDNWKQLLKIYGTRIVHEFIVTPEGLREKPEGEVVSAQRLISMLNDGFSKSGDTNKIVYSKQKGRIEDESGKTITVGEMIALLTS